MSDPMRFRAGWLLDPRDRAELLKAIPPRYPQTVAHHVTLKFGDQPPWSPAETLAEAVGVADDGAGVQAVVVRIGGRTERPDGGTFHITWSLGEGREARESNAVIADQGWAPLAQPIALRLAPRPAGPDQ